MSYMKSPVNAQELTQDVFVKIWQHRAQLTGVENFKSYLFILSRNQIISAIRKKLRETALDPDFDIPEEFAQPDRQLHFKEVEKWINEGIGALPPMRRQVFRMSRMQGMTHEEIAAQLGIARNTVKQHIVLALNSLREHLRQYTDLAPVLLAFVFLEN